MRNAHGVAAVREHFAFWEWERSQKCSLKLKGGRRFSLEERRGGGLDWLRELQPSSR